MVPPKALIDHGQGTTKELPPKTFAKSAIVRSVIISQAIHHLSNGIS